jgi:proline dehydrogenase
MAIASRVTKRALSTFAAAKLPEEAVAAAAAGEAIAATTAAAVPLASSERTAIARAALLQFEDTGRLFAGEPTSALLRTLAALQALSVGPLVDAATAALRSPAVAGSALGRAAARATAYRHFCAGETADEAAAVVRRLWRGGMGGILDYGIEDAEDGDACDRNAAGFISAVDVAAALPPGSVSRRLLYVPPLGFSSVACMAVGREAATSDGIFGAVCCLREGTDPRIPWESSRSRLPCLVNRPAV